MQNVLAGKSSANQGRVGEPRARDELEAATRHSSTGGKMRPKESRAARRRVLPPPARSGGVLLAALAIVLCGAAAAVAALATPTLVKPASKGSVHVNKIELVVRDSSSLAKK